VLENLQTNSINNPKFFCGNAFTFTMENCHKSVSTFVHIKLHMEHYVRTLMFDYRAEIVCLQ
jgi:hypothetical protein